MKLTGKVAVVTGAGNGIGAAIARRFAAEGARVVVADIEADVAEAVAADIGGIGIAADLAVESEVQRVVETAGRELGPVDVWHSNAGIDGRAGAFGDLGDDARWDNMWHVNVMSHLYAARAVLPSMLERGDGYLLATASNTALSILPDKIDYSVTKRAALALSEWLAVTYRPQGIKVSCYCPGAMRTRMFAANGFAEDSPAFQHALTPEQVAEVVVAGIDAERFLILNNPNDVNVLADKAADYDGWVDTKMASYLTLVGAPHQDGDPVNDQEHNR